MHLLDQRGIPREPLRVQTAHLIDQRLQLLLRLGTILHGRAHLVEKVQSLIDFTLRIGRIGTTLLRLGPICKTTIAGVKALKRAATAVSAPSASIGYCTRDTIADL